MGRPAGNAGSPLVLGSYRRPLHRRILIGGNVEGGRVGARAWTAVEEPQT